MEILKQSNQITLMASKLKGVKQCCHINEEIFEYLDSIKQSLQEKIYYLQSQEMMDIQQIMQ